MADPRKATSDDFNDQKEIQIDIIVCSKELIENVHYTMIEIKPSIAGEFNREYIVAQSVPFIKDTSSGRIYLIGRPRLILASVVDRHRIELVQCMNPTPTISNISLPGTFFPNVGGHIEKYFGQFMDRNYYYIDDLGDYKMTTDHDMDVRPPNLVFVQNKTFEVKLFNSLINKIPR